MFRTDAQEVLLDFNLDSGGSRTRWERSENLKGARTCDDGFVRVKRARSFRFFFVSVMTSRFRITAAPNRSIQVVLWSGGRCMGNRVQGRPIITRSEVR